MNIRRMHRRYNANAEYKRGLAVARKIALMEAGKWEDPPPDVPEIQWIDALYNGYAANYRSLPPKKMTDEDFRKMKGEMYND